MGVNGYDIIGDVHGHADALETLLVKMVSALESASIK